MPNLSTTYIMLRIRAIGSEEWITPTQPQEIDYIREDFDSEDTGRFMSGDMDRDRITTKIKLQCRWGYLRSDEVSEILNAIEPVFFEVQFFDFMIGEFNHTTMYAGSKEIPFYNVLKDQNGAIIGVKSFSVNLIEK